MRIFFAGGIALCTIITLHLHHCQETSSLIRQCSPVILVYQLNLSLRDSASLSESYDCRYTARCWKRVYSDAVSSVSSGSLFGGVWTPSELKRAMVRSVRARIPLLKANLFLFLRCLLTLPSIFASPSPLWTHSFH